MSTVPDKVKQLVSAQLFHDRKQNDERAHLTSQQRDKTKKVDFLVPCIADADAGFGGITSVMKLVKLFIDAGAGGIHIEDQKPGVKKCGHLGGKVLVSVREHVSRLQAARLQADVMNCDLVICARTDAMSATFLDSNIDPIDHPFILGSVDPKDPSKLLTFPQAGRIAIIQNFKGEEREKIIKLWENHCLHMSLADAQDMARKNGFDFYFDWETCRTDEGYYRIDGSVAYSIKRGLAFADYADMLWMETPTPELSVAKEFADGIHALKPHVFLSYNLSPSFNWDAQKMTEDDIENFIPNLAQMGYCWQFITLAGFHMDALISEVFTKAYEKQGMLAFVQYIQRKEKSENVDQLLHQKWSGANLKDREVELATNNKSSTLANTKHGGSTEEQFTEAGKKQGPGHH